MRYDSTRENRHIVMTGTVKVETCCNCDMLYPWASTWCGYSIRIETGYYFNPSCTDWVQGVPRRGILLNSSCWYRVTVGKRYNCKLCGTFNESNVSYIKVQRLAWTGHLVLMKNGGILRKIFDTKRNELRRDGRPKLRWEDGVDQGVRTIEVKNWIKLALERGEWAKLLKKTRANGGLSS